MTIPMEKIVIIDWDFLTLPILASLLIPLLSAPMGCILIWRRMTFFGDTLAHASMLGAALAIVMQMAVIYGLIIVSLLMAVILTISQKDKSLSHDSWLGVISYGALAMGLLLLYGSGIRGIDPHQILIGDILTASWEDVGLIAMVAVCSGIFIYANWQQIILLTLDLDFAKAKQVNTQRVELLLMLTLSMAIAAILKIIGALLAPALLIFPAVTARKLANSPVKMIYVAIATGILMNCVGLFGSLHFDCPTGPAIILTGVIIFAIIRVVPNILLKMVPPR